MTGVAAEEKLERLLLEGINSGDPTLLDVGRGRMEEHPAGSGGAHRRQAPFCMSHRIIRLRQARHDLIETAVYLEERNPEAAQRFLAAVEKTIAAIALMPGIGAECDFPPLDPCRAPHAAGAWLR